MGLEPNIKNIKMRTINNIRFDFAIEANAEADFSLGRSNIVKS